MKIGYKATFIRQFNKLEVALQEEVLGKLGLLRDVKNHKQLKVQKLNGPLSGRYSFSVNYKTRIVFSMRREEITLLAIGDHAVYDT